MGKQTEKGLKSYGIHDCDFHWTLFPPLQQVLVIILGVMMYIKQEVYLGSCLETSGLEGHLWGLDWGYLVFGEPVSCVLGDFSS